MAITLLFGQKIQSGSIPAHALSQGVVSSSVQINTGSFTGSFTGTFAGTASYALTASVALNLPSNIVTSSGQINTGSFSGSFIGNLTGTASLATTASYVLPSGLPTNTVSQSIQIDITQTTGYSTFSSSLFTVDNGQNLRLNAIESRTGSYATTSSNTFIGNQTISGSIFLSSSTVLVGNVSGNVFGTSSWATTASFALNVPQTIVSSAAQINTGSFSGSFIGNLTGTASLATTSSYVLPSGLPAGTVSQSIQVDITQTTGYSTFSSSLFNVDNGQNLRLNAIEARTGSYATTASNTFIGNQTISGSVFLSASSAFNGTLTGSVFGTASWATSASWAPPAAGTLSSSNGNFTGTFNGSLTGSLLSNNGVVSASSQIDITQTTGYTTFSSSNAAVDAAQNLRLNAIESRTGSYATTSSNTFIGNQTISGSVFLSASAAFNGALTGSVFGTASWATSASWAPAVAGTISSSNGNFTGTFNGSLTGSLLSNNGVVSASSQVDITQTTNYTTFSSSLATVDNGQNLRLNSIESRTGSYATTSSNTFIGNQTISGSIFLSSSTALNGIVSGNLFGTSSWATTASFALNVPQTIVSAAAQINTGSFSGSFTGNLIGTASLATTASYVLPSGLPAGTVSQSIQIDITQTTGYSTFSSSNATVDAAQNLRLNTIESRTGSYATTSSNTFIGNQTISGSVFLSSSTALNGIVSGNVFGTSSWATTASFALNVPQTIVSAAAQINTGSFSGSFIGNLTGTASLATTASYILPSGLPAGTVSQSIQIDITQTTGYTTFSSSNAAVDAAQNLRLNAIESRTGSYATTSSNTFTGNQIITGSVFLSSSTALIGNVSGNLFGTSSWATTASFALNVPQVIISSAAQINTGSFSGSFTGTGVFSGSIASPLILTGSNATAPDNATLAVSGSIYVLSGSTTITGRGPSTTTPLTVSIPGILSNTTVQANDGVVIDNSSLYVRGRLVVQERYYSPNALTTTPGKITLLSHNTTTAAGLARIVLSSLQNVDVGIITTKEAPATSNDDFLSIRTVRAVPLYFGTQNSESMWRLGTDAAFFPTVNNSYNLGSSTNIIASGFFTNVNASIVSASTAVTSSGMRLTGLTDTTATNKILVLDTTTNQLFTTTSVGAGGSGNGFPYDGRTTPAFITGSLIVSGSTTITGSLSVTQSIQGTPAIRASGSIRAISGSTTVYNSAESSTFGGLYVETTQGGLTNAFIKAGDGTVYIGSNTSNVFLSAGGINSGLVTTTGIEPGSNLNFDLGASGNRWRTVWAGAITASNGLFGTASQAITASYALAAPGGGLTGGTTNYIPLWTGTGTLSSSIIFQNTGNVGINTTTPNRQLSVNGSANVTGSLDVSGAFTAQTKSFKILHQTQPGKSLVYGVLEGPEHAVYARGRLTNTNVIKLPDEWSWLIDPDSITVQLTPIGKHQKVYVKEIVNGIIFVDTDNMFTNNLDCYYLVHATRKDVDPLETVV